MQLWPAHPVVAPVAIYAAMVVLPVAQAHLGCARFGVSGPCPAAADRGAGQSTAGAGAAGTQRRRFGGAGEARTDRKLVQVAALALKHLNGERAVVAESLVVIALLQAAHLPQLAALQRAARQTRSGTAACGRGTGAPACAAHGVVATSVQQASRSRHEADVKGRRAWVGLAAKASAPSRARQSFMALRGSNKSAGAQRRLIRAWCSVGVLDSHRHSLR